MMTAPLAPFPPLHSIRPQFFRFTGFGPHPDPRVSSYLRLHFVFIQLGGSP